MAIQRIVEIFTTNFSHRFSVIYGPGIEDSYINKNLVELKFEEALFEELTRQGFDRIVFYSLHQSVFFFDDQSRQLSRPKLEKFASNRIASGPLSDFKAIRFSPTTEPALTGIKDIHALRFLDSLLRETGTIRTAIIFLQAEITLRYFDDARLLSGLVSDWSRLPSKNLNRVFFVFAADNYSELTEIAPGIQIPELRNAILRQNLDPNLSYNLHLVAGPDRQEVASLLVEHQRRGLVIKAEDSDSLRKRIAAENKQLRYWISVISKQRELSLEIARKANWFSNVINTQKNAWEQLDGMIGLEQVKQRVQEMVAWVSLSIQEQEEKARTQLPNLHMVFTGNPGTGKTTIARLFGEIYFELGILSRGHLVEVKGNDLVADYVGGTAIKTNQIIDKALGGVLFIDEAYMLTEKERGGFGQEALDMLLVRLEEDRHRLVVIVAGYPDKMRLFRETNPGLARRFPEENVIDFPDYTNQELFLVLNNFLADRGLTLSDDLHQKLPELVHNMLQIKDASFGNAGEMRNLAEGLDRRRAARLHASRDDTDRDLLVSDLPEAYAPFLPLQNAPSEVVLNEIDSLVGLENVKLSLHSLATRLHFDITRRKLSGGQVKQPSLLHMVFMGNPGTGKTTIARLIGKLYKSFGLLQKGHCVEVSRADLVAGFIGQSAINMKKKIHEALGGVLFIDEAYSLIRGGENDFGLEVIDTLVKEMEDNKNKLLVIAAGYTREMEGFLDKNPGLKSRFPSSIMFDDYTVDELVEIILQRIHQEGFVMMDKVGARIADYLVAQQFKQGSSFGNARAALVLYESIKNNLAKRVMQQLDHIPEDAKIELVNSILPEDVPTPEIYINSLFQSPTQSSTKQRVGLRQPE